MKIRLSILIALLASSAWGFYGDYSSPGLDTASGYENPPWSIIFYSDIQDDPDTEMPLITADFTAFYKKINAKAILFGGDMTLLPAGGSVGDELTVASTQVGLIDALGLPHLLTTGNHDYEYDDWFADPVATRNLDEWNAAFPLTRYTTSPFRGAEYDTDSELVWLEFAHQGIDYLLITYEFGGRDTSLVWVESVIAAHPNHQIIVLTHAYLGNEAFNGATKVDLASAYYCGCTHPPFEDAGEQNTAVIWWDDVFSEYDNVRLILCGHNWVPIVDPEDYTEGFGMGRLTENGDAGNPVTAIIADYEFYEYQNGVRDLIWRYYMYYPRTQTMRAYTWSHYKEEYLMADPHNFTFRFRN